MKKMSRNMGILVIVCILFVSGCGKSDEKKLLGTWYEIDSYSGKPDYDEELSFFEDGVFYGFDEDGTYWFSDGKLVLHVKWIVSEFEERFDYQFEGDTLILIRDDGKEFRYLKESDV